MLVLDDKTVTANSIVKKRKLTIVKNAIELVVKPQENVYYLIFTTKSLGLAPSLGLTPSVDEDEDEDAAPFLVPPF
jgi:hypothetical protein